MAREIDERKKRKALRKLRKAQELAEQGLGPPLSDWEREFLEEVGQRIETYGSAFGDGAKGDLEEPLSTLQQVKLKEIDKKARGKGKTGFQRGPVKRPARDDVDAPDDTPAPAPMQDPPTRPTVRPSGRPSGRPAFRVIEGGKTD